MLAGGFRRRLPEQARNHRGGQRQGRNGREGAILADAENHAVTGFLEMQVASRASLLYYRRSAIQLPEQVPLVPWPLQMPAPRLLVRCP